MRNNPDLSEQWVQRVLEGDPSLLGVGDLDVRDIERRRRNAGRLDMLLNDPEGSTRYEVELQPGDGSSNGSAR